MNAKKTLGAIVAAAFLGSGAAGCASLNRTLYEAGDEIRFKYEEVKNPLEWHSMNPDYRMTVAEEGQGKVVIVDNNRDFYINEKGNDKVIVTMDGKTVKYDKSTKEGQEVLEYINMIHGLVIMGIQDKLPKDLQEKLGIDEPVDAEEAK